MPVRKFRSVAEMKLRRLEPGTDELFATIRRLWDFGRRTSRRRYRPGVYRFRSIEEMQKGRLAIVIEGDADGRS